MEFSIVDWIDIVDAGERFDSPGFVTAAFNSASSAEPGGTATQGCTANLSNRAVRSDTLGDLTVSGNRNIFHNQSYANLNCLEVAVRCGRDIS